MKISVGALPSLDHQAGSAGLRRRGQATYPMIMRVFHRMVTGAARVTGFVWGAAFGSLLAAACARRDAFAGRGRTARGVSGRRLRCRDVMSDHVVVLGTGESVAGAARKMRELNVGFLPVCTSDQRLMGVVTDRDLAVRVLADERPGETAVQDVMTDDVVSCPADAEVAVAEALMRAHRKNRIVCVDERGRVVGVVSVADLARYTSAREAGDLLGEVVGREVHA